METSQWAHQRDAEGGDLVPAAEEIVSRYKRIEVADHPFFITLAQGPIDLEAVYLLMANLQQGISGSLVSRLAGTIARVDDRRVASVLAKQLNDELGAGDFSQIRSVLLERFVTALSPWCARADDEALLGAGRRLSRDGARPFLASDPSEALGALMVSRIFAGKMDACLVHDMRRQLLVTGQSLRWLDIGAHQAQDSSDLAVLLPREGLSLFASWRGAIDQWGTLWRFLDDVHEMLIAMRG
ncbi:MAG TPA: hypothetical protein VFH68_03275 [Polyangia bacterium]|jgi:hypothetical protein|nr:hypothetical protein [Polyangia bacterium]